MTFDGTSSLNTKLHDGQSEVFDDAFVVKFKQALCAQFPAGSHVAIL